LPWYDYRLGQFAVDPIYGYYRAHRPAADWDRQIRALYDARYAGTSPRPPRTLVEQQRVAASPPTVTTPAAAVQQAAALAPAKQAEAVGLKVEKVTQEQRAKLHAAAKQRADAAHGYQETQLRKLVEAQKGTLAPAVPVPVQAPPLPKAAAQPITPMPKQPMTTTPPPMPKQPTTPATQPPMPKQPTTPTPPATPPGQAKKQPPPLPIPAVEPPKGPAKKEEPKKPDEPKKKGKGDDKKKDGG
jgi:hypothetical protein